MRTVLSGLGVTLLLCACGDAPKGSSEHTTLSNETPEAPHKETERNSKSIQLRALFYMERKHNDRGVVAFPATPAPTLGDGDQAWLEVHTNGAKYAYAFAFLDQDRILPLWSETITKNQHTPPMRAFGDDLALSKDFDPPAKLVVIATDSALENADQAADCPKDDLAICDQLQNIADLNIQSNRGGTNQLKMKFGEIKVGAYGDSAAGNGLVAIAFPFMAPTEP